MKETAEQYVERVTKEAKEFYKTPEAMKEEMIKLIDKMPEVFKDEIEKQWNLLVAISEAWHIVVWTGEDNHAKRLVNTIFAFVKDNIAL